MGCSFWRPKFHAMFVCVVGVKKEFAKYSMDIFFVALFRWDGPCMNHPWFWGGGQHGHYSKWHGSIFPVSKYSKSSSGWFCINSGVGSDPCGYSVADACCVNHTLNWMAAGFSSVLFWRLQHKFIHPMHSFFLQIISW